MADSKCPLVISSDSDNEYIIISDIETNVNEVEVRRNVHKQACILNARRKFFRNGVESFEVNAKKAGYASLICRKEVDFASSSSNVISDQSFSQFCAEETGNMTSSSDAYCQNSNDNTIEIIVYETDGHAEKHRKGHKFDSPKKSKMTWCQMKKEKEIRKHHPPRKRRRISSDDEDQQRPIHCGSSSEDDFSDDLPDLEIADSFFNQRPGQVTTPDMPPTLDYFGKSKHKRKKWTQGNTTHFSRIIIPDNSSDDDDFIIPMSDKESQKHNNKSSLETKLNANTQARHKHVSAAVAQIKHSSSFKISNSSNEIKKSNFVINKEKLTNILSKGIESFKIKTDKTSDVSGSLSSDKNRKNSNLVDSPSNDRHFLDAISVSEKYDTKTSFHLEKDDNSARDLTGVISGVFRPNSVKKIVDVNTYTKKNCIPGRIVKCSNISNNLVDIRNYFPSTTLSSREVTSALFKPTFVSGVQGNCSYSNKDHIDLDSMHINIIEACLEEGKDFIDHALQFVNDFTVNYKPTKEIVDSIIEEGLLADNSIEIILKSYCCLMKMLQLYPNLVTLSWDVIETMMVQLHLTDGFTEASSLKFLQCAMGLKFVLAVLEAELRKKNLADIKVLRGTMAFKLLSSDYAYANLKTVVTWIRCLLTSSQYDEMREGYLNLHIGQPNKGHHLPDGSQGNKMPRAQEVQKVLPLLQKLLFVGIQVSSSCIESTKRLAADLNGIYSYLAGLEQKKLLLNSIESELLQFKLVQLILENHCDQTISCCEDFPVSLRSLAECYFKALPPKYCLTPPLTPSSETEEESHQIQYSSSNTEELAMLLYYAVYGYIKASKEKQHYPLKRKLIPGTSMELHEIDKKQLRKLFRHLNLLRQHLLDLCGELSSQTEQYLIRLVCLTESAK